MRVKTKVKMGITAMLVIFACGFTGCDETGKVEGNAQVQGNGTQESAQTTNNTVEKEDTIKEWNDDSEKQIIDLVREEASKQYSKFSVTISQKNLKIINGSYVTFVEVYENTFDGSVPRVNYYLVNEKTLQFESDEFYSMLATVDVRKKYNIERLGLIYLVNDLEKLKISDFIPLLENITFHSASDKIFDDIKFDCYVFEYNKIYYIYDSNSGKLYKKTALEGTLNEIYQFDPAKNSLSIIEKADDLDGDGTKEKIQFDIIRGVLTVNGVTIYTKIKSFLAWDIVDIDSSDKYKEIRITSQTNSKEYTSYFFYENGKVSYSGYCIGIPAIDGKGTLKYPPDNSFLEKSFEEVELDKNHTLRWIDKDYYFKDPDIRKTNKEVPLLKAKNSEEVIATVGVGETLKILALDFNKWYLVEDSKGVKGYINNVFQYLD